MSQVPSIHALTHHLAQCPADFRAPRVGEHGSVHVDAVVFDVVVSLGYHPDPDQLDVFRMESASDRNWAATVLVGCWLVHHPSFRTLGVGERVYEWLRRGLKEVAKLIAAQHFVEHPDRREELARLLMHSLRMPPAGESLEQAADRLSTVNSVERVRVFRATQAQRQRAKELRRQMAEQRARDAAAKYSRE